MPPMLIPGLTALFVAIRTRSPISVQNVSQKLASVRIRQPGNLLRRPFSDWVIDLGPEGGDRGGYIVGEGPPEKIARLSDSHTGKFLAHVLNGNGASRSNGDK